MTNSSFKILIQSYVNTVYGQGSRAEISRSTEPTDKFGYAGYTLYVTDSKSRLLAKSVEQQGWRSNHWDADQYGTFMGTLKLVDNGRASEE